MIHRIDRPDFFEQSEKDQLTELGILGGESGAASRLAFASLMLAPLLELATKDGATNPSEFQAIEEYTELLERRFQLSTKEELEEVGTIMGMLPFIRGQWEPAHFVHARGVLAAALERLDPDDANQLRSAMSQACYQLAKSAGGSILNIHTLHDAERPLLHDIIESLRLDTTAEGLHLLSRVD